MINYKNYIDVLVFNAVEITFPSAFKHKNRKTMNENDILNSIQLRKQA